MQARESCTNQATLCETMPFVSYDSFVLPAKEINELYQGIRHSENMNVM